MPHKDGRSKRDRSRPGSSGSRSGSKSGFGDRKLRSGDERSEAIAQGMIRAEKIYRILKDLSVRLLPRGQTPKTPIRILLDPEASPSDFARHLVESILASGPKAPSGTHAFTLGRIYCYHCDSNDCEHAAPPDHLSVFRGYLPTGYPLWDGLSTVLLDQGDSRIDALVDEHEPEVLARDQHRGELKSEQLKVFGRDSRLYDILGQVVAGYLPLPRGQAGGRLAVTFQTVRCLERSRWRFRLNVLGRLPDGTDLAKHLLLEPEIALDGLLGRTRKRLEELELRRMPPGTFDHPDHPVRPLLTQLARGVERIYRRQKRRTRHAADRRHDRPQVGLALKDLKRAGRERFYHDERKGTFIVIGPKWRIHVFGEDGLHVDEYGPDPGKGVQADVSIGDGGAPQRQTNKKR